MCTIIVTIRAVLWYVVSLAGTLMILVSLFTNRWLINRSSAGQLEGFVADNLGQTVGNAVDNALGSSPYVGLFPKCKEPGGTKFFEGECIPDFEHLARQFSELDDSEYPHAWRGAVICFGVGLGLMVITCFFALMTLCCRRCVCCSVFTVCGSVQSFAGLLFTLGLVAYPAGWGSKAISDKYCAGNSGPFMLGDSCAIGIAFWLAVAGTVCTCVASSLAICAYQSTKSTRCEMRQDEGEKCICLP